MSVASAVVEMLKQYQVDVLFSVPDDAVISQQEALHDTGGKRRQLMNRDERSAFCIDDVYARLSHKLGVGESPSSTGPLYAIPGFSEANASSLTPILIPSNIALAGEGKQTIAELRCQKLFETRTNLFSASEVVALSPVYSWLHAAPKTGRPET